MNTKFLVTGLLLLGLLVATPTATATHVCNGSSCYGVFPGGDECFVVIATWTGVNSDGDWQDPGETLHSHQCVEP